MNKNKIVITGGLGFIGSNLIDFLIDKKINVINIDKVSYSSNFYNVKNYKNNKLYKFYKININNKSEILKIFKKEKPKCVFNLAAETHVDRSIDNPYPFVLSNINGTFNLLEAFREYKEYNKNIKFVHISTDEVYGDIVKGRSKENDSYKPSSPYAASKASADHLVYSYYKTYKLPLIITNCTNNYGPKQHPEKFIPKMIYNLINNLDLTIYGNGKNSREWLHVKDHCEAIYKVYKKGKIGQTYNIGSYNNINNIKVCHKLIKIKKKFINNNKSKIKFVKDRPGHDNRYALNSNKIKKKLKWKCKISFNKGLEETFFWYLQNYKYFKNLKKKDIKKRLGLSDK